jgi:plastocyanin domain-containing protein
MKRKAWMSGILAGAVGAAAIVAVGCGGAGGTGGGSGARVELAVTENGFEPSEIQAKKGVPLTLAVTRKTDATCAKEIVIADQKIRKDLPLNETVEVTFTPSDSGEIPYVCGMDMITGKIVVR